MIRLLTGLPRNTGVGEFTAQCARAIGDPVEVYYRKPLTAKQYDMASDGSRSIISEAFYYAKIWSSLRSDADRTHVMWEGFGTVFGKKTRLISVHHVIFPDDPWARNPEAPLAKRIAYRMALRAYHAIAANCPRIVVPSVSTRDALHDGYGVAKSLIDVVPYAVDTEFYSPGSRIEAREKLALPPDAFVVLRVSSDDRRKNSEGVARIWQEMAHDHGDHLMIHVGLSPYLRTLAAAGQLERIRFLDSVDRVTLRSLYRAADVLLHPSFTEGFSFVVLEAMSCGTPAVVSDIPVFREELGRTLIGAPAGDTLAFVEILRRLKGGCYRPSPTSLRSEIAEKFAFTLFRERLSTVYRRAGFL